MNDREFEEFLRAVSPAARASRSDWTAIALLGSSTFVTIAALATSLMTAGADIGLTL